MAKTIVGLFDHYEKAESAVRELTAHGFAPESIGMVAHDHRQDRSAALTDDSSAAEGAAMGATGGAVLGGLGGLLLGIGAIAIPGIGPVIAAGPIVAALSGAAVGAGLGGIVGSLSGMGVPEEEALYYAEGVRSGGTLVTVHVDHEGEWTAMDILRRHGADEVERRKDDAVRSETREPAVAANATLERPAASSRIPESTDVTAWENECREHFNSNLAACGRTYDEVRPAYEFGYQAASDPRFAGGNWEQAESNMRQEWSTRGQCGWDEVQEAVRCGWYHGRQRESVAGPRIEGFSGVRDMRSPFEREEETVTGDSFDERSGTRI